MTPEAVRDECRREVAARGLTPTAVAHLTRDALGGIDLARLAPVKTQLKRFFSDAPWNEGDDNALAEAVGPGQGWWRHNLEASLGLEFGWRDGTFRLAVFDASVIPEATPNPRTIRFVTGPIHEGPSRWYESAAGVDDPRVARLFAEFDEVANVLVGPDFVAVGLRRPDQWERLLDSMLRVVTTEFAPTAPSSTERDAAAVVEHSPSAPRFPPSPERDGAFDRAWRELGTLRAEQPDDLDRILAALSSSDVAARQVAARLVVGADDDVAETAWARLLVDPSRRVRRATVDAMVDAARPALRSLLERALHDADAWTRWKALRGLVELGIAPSRAPVAALAEDPDFRVRLEAAGALRRAPIDQSSDE